MTLSILDHVRMGMRRSPVARPHGQSWAVKLLVFGVIATLVGCASPHKKLRKPVSSKHINNTTKFSSKDYGVKASKRVSVSKKVRKGGGRYQVGKPYKIKGKWYRPREQPGYNKVGMASWYGPNFHGRLTANGEVYDQYALSAAHPTLPLPSYAKVTNLKNGASVTVRVNDRGPFSNKRIIDLSARASQLLGYQKQGLAKVRVQYVGKARMDGLDDRYLMASYRPGKGQRGLKLFNNSPDGQNKLLPGFSRPGTMIASAKTSKSTINSNNNGTVLASYSPAKIGQNRQPSQFALVQIPVPTQRPTPLYEGTPILLSEFADPNRHGSEQIRVAEQIVSQQHYGYQPSVVQIPTLASMVEPPAFNAQSIVQRVLNKLNNN